MQRMMHAKEGEETKRQRPSLPNSIYATQQQPQTTLELAWMPDASLLFMQIEVLS